MALWGNNDNISSAGLVSCDYSTLIVTGQNTTFGQVGSAKIGDVIRFGRRDGVYMGDAVIISIESPTQLSIASTVGLSGVAIASTDFTISELPKYTVLDSKYSQATWGTHDSHIYGASEAGVSAAHATKYELTHAGWVGVTTYVDCHGELRVKKEVLVAMSGISTGNAPIYDNNPLV